MKILCLLPHIDDEMGMLPLWDYFCRKFAAKFSFCYFSDCQKSCQQLGFNANILKQENSVVIEKLGGGDNVRYFDYPVREFFKFRQDILEDMTELKKNLQPDVVVLPCSKDVHQDHKCIFEEGCRCFKNHATLIGFSYPWNEFGDANNFFVEVDELGAENVIALLGNYKSQKSRLYMQKDFIRANLIANGIKISKPMAAGYELIKGRLCL